MRINETFLEQYKTKPVDWGPVGEVVYRRTYSRDGEVWHQTVRRVVEGCYEIQKKHCLEEGRPWSDAKAQHSMQQMYGLIFAFKFLPPGRGLFTVGVPGLLEKTGAAANNCGMVSTKSLSDDLCEPFCWAMDHLMLGVGVGFDVLGAGVKLVKPHFSCGWRGEAVALTCRVEDSREGWVNALRVLLTSYMPGYGQIIVEFDYSLIRPQGSPVGFGGTASGPEPLREMLESIRGVLDKAARYGGALTSTDIVDIFNMIGRCVVSGNIRRSAQIAFGSPDDAGFTQLKNVDTHPAENASHRWAANHSVVCKVGQDYDRLLDDTHGVSELGVLYLENAQRYGRMGGPPDYGDLGAVGSNPCAEQTLEDKELCCLVEVFPSRIKDYYEFQRTLKYAYLYAKTITLVKVHDAASQGVISRNRRIGCSLTGIQPALVKHGSNAFYEWCDKGYSYLKSLDDRYSTWFGIPHSVKLTSVKPSGTVSKLPGVASGIHFPPAESYYQVIRFATDNPVVEAYKAAGYRCYDLAPGEPNTTAIYFGVIEENFSRAESEVSAWEQALHAVKMQRHWADNQVSITVKYDDRSEIPRILRMVEHDIKAISFIPKTEHGYKHAPWQPAPKEEIQEYLDGLSAVVLEQVDHDRTDEFCSGDSCQVEIGGGPASSGYLWENGRWVRPFSGEEIEAWDKPEWDEYIPETEEV